MAFASEHTTKNTDTFVTVFSLLSGQIVHISDQATSILKCKKKMLDSSRFVELLVPQDVRVFYMHTEQSHLPLWNMESQTVSSQTPISADLEETLKEQTATNTVGTPLVDLALTNELPSVVSVTSQCSYSSTIVRIPHLESEVTTMEDAAVGSEHMELPSVNAQSLVIVLEELKPIGLTKETLSAHTQKEEKDYIDKFCQKILLSQFRTYLQQGSRSNSGHSCGQGDFLSKQMSSASCRRSKQGKFKRQKPQRQSSDTHSSNKNRNNLPCEKRTIQKQSFCPSEVSYQNLSNTNAFPPMGFSVSSDLLVSFPASPLGELSLKPLKPEPMSSSQLCCEAQSFPLPNIGRFMAISFHSFPAYPQMPQSGFLPTPQYACPSSSYSYVTQPAASPPHTSSAGALSSVSEPLPVFPALSTERKQEDHCDEAALFSSSQSSSPLQLNLLQEVLPRPVELPVRNDAKAHVDTANERRTGIRVGQFPYMGIEKASPASADSDPEASANSGSLCPSAFAEFLLHEDSQSSSAAAGSGSALSSSLGCSSNEASGCGPAGIGKSSRYFASNDSSEAEEKGTPRKSKCESVCVMMDHTPEQMVMTYQLPNRIKEEVLKEDLEKLIVMQKQQPWFTEGQKKELPEVHSWIWTQTVPQQINTQGCVTCEMREVSHEAAMVDDHMEKKGKSSPLLQS